MSCAEEVLGPLADILCSGDMASKVGLQTWGRRVRGRVLWDLSLAQEGASTDAVFGSLAQGGGGGSASTDAFFHRASANSFFLWGVW